METSNGLGLSVTRERIAGLYANGSSHFAALRREGGGTEMEDRGQGSAGLIEHRWRRDSVSRCNPLSGNRLWPAFHELIEAWVLA